MGLMSWDLVKLLQKSWASSQVKNNSECNGTKITPVRGDFTWLPLQPGLMKVSGITGDSIFFPSLCFCISYYVLMTEKMPPNKLYFKLYIKKSTEASSVSGNDYKDAERYNE